MCALGRAGSTWPGAVSGALTFGFTVAFGLYADHALLYLTLRPLPRSQGARRIQAMTLYVVEHRLLGMTESDLALLTAALKATSERLARRGRKVRYLRSTYLPGQERLLCWYEAASQEMVRTVIESAQAPYLSLEAAIEVVSPRR